MSRHRVDLQTPDGVLDCYVFEPAGAGSWPAVVLYMDAFGVRDDLDVMAARLADAGYVVAVPNLYHRAGAFPPFDPALVAAGGAERDRFMGMIKSINGDLVMQDTAAVLTHLDTRPSVRPGPVGTVGYCMGGGLAMRTAAAAPKTVGACVSFHGSRLVSPEADSPHTLVPKITAQMYFGFAIEDRTMPPEAVEKLKATLDAAGAQYGSEVYAGARHGWCVKDHNVYNEPQAERAWSNMLKLFREALN